MNLAGNSADISLAILNRAVKTLAEPCADPISGQKPCTGNTEGRAKQTDGTTECNEK